MPFLRSKDIILWLPDVQIFGVERCDTQMVLWVWKWDFWIWYLDLLVVKMRLLFSKKRFLEMQMRVFVGLLVVKMRLLLLKMRVFWIFWLAICSFTCALGILYIFLCLKLSFRRHKRPQKPTALKKPKTPRTPKRSGSVRGSKRWGLGD